MKKTVAILALGVFLVSARAEEPPHLEFVQRLRASHYPDVKKIDDLEERIRRLDAAAIAAIHSPLTGDDLMARTRRPAGPWIKRVKSALEDAIIDGTLPPDPESAWRYLDSHPELLRD